jgi:murein DD-endopeptidase MepM/ murein hydrolase activator NlpD
VIIASEKEDDFNGYYVVIDHDEPYDGTGYTSWYLHLREQPKVRKDQQVPQGKILGHMGDTGKGVGVHLHFQMKFGDRRNFSTEELRSVLIEGLKIEDFSVGCRTGNPPTGFYSSTNTPIE